MPHLEHVDVSEVSSQEMTAAFKVQVFESDIDVAQVASYVGSMQATSCKNKVWDPPATKGNALQQLRLKALRAGANALVNVNFDDQGTDTWGTNCWQSVTATGDAVVMR
jgi:uncharacterized protein YbjQ (UPF0145 family)